MACIIERKTSKGKYYYLAECVDGKRKQTYLGTKRPMPRSRGWANLSQATIDWLKRQRQTPSNIKSTLKVPTKGKYHTLVVDPPWPIERIDLKVRSEEEVTPYPTLPLSTIKRGTGKIPIKRLIDKGGCHVYLWTTQKHLTFAFEVLQCWGFKHIFTMVWHKNRGMQCIHLPQYNCEFVLFGRKGNLPFLDTKAFATCFYAPAKKGHSRKPGEFYELVRRVSPAPRLDMFSREPRDGFDQYGNEASKYDQNG